MDDDSLQAPPHSWKGLLRGFLLVVLVALAGALALTALLKNRPVDLRERTRSAAEAVDRLLADNGFGANRTQRTDEGQKSDDKAIWNAYRYRIDLPADKTAEDVRLLLAKDLASLKVAVEVLPEGKGLRLLLGGPFAEIELVSAASELPVTPIMASLPEAPPPFEAAPVEMTPVAPPSDPAPPAAAEPAPAVEPEEGYSPLTPTKPAPKPPVPSELAPEPPVPSQSAPKQVAVAAAPALPAGVRPRIAIIVDDGGYGGDVGEAILALDPALTLSILPNTPGATELARQAAARGFEIMLHMPMEAEDSSDKTLSPLSVTMAPEEIRGLTEKALAQIPGAVGVNNHEGSKFTGDARAMTAFLESVKAHSLYFIDSRTSPLTLAADTAQSLGIRTASRDVFLDNDPAEATFRVQFAALLAQARKNGSAIGICHFRESSARVLGALLNGLGEREGVDLVHVSQVLP